MNPDSIFAKTAKGNNEVKSRTLGLDHNMRSALIMVDGKTSLDVLVERFARIGIADGNDAIRKLEALGLIVLQAAGQSVASKSIPRVATQQAQNIEALKKQLAGLIENYFGFMAAPHLNRLALCRNRDELLAYVSQCQKLIREAFNEHKASEFGRKADSILS